MKSYNRKKIQYLIIIWGALIIAIGVFLILFFLVPNDIIVFSIAFGEIIVLFFLLIFCKGKISFYDLQYRYQSLLVSSVGRGKTNCYFDSFWLENLKKSGYQLQVDNDLFTILFRVSKSLARKTFMKTTIIEIINIVKNNKTDLYANQIEDEYKKIWAINEKKYRINKQVILQFKKFDEYNDDIKAELDKVIAFREMDNYLITINCGYFTKDQTLYYLHSDKYAPNAYYQYGVDLIKEITK